MELPENREIVEMYGPAGSSRGIGAYDRNGCSKEENTRAWDKIGHGEEYMEHLKGVIEKRLAGDFSRWT